MCELSTGNVFFVLSPCLALVPLYVPVQLPLKCFCSPFLLECLQFQHCRIAPLSLQHDYGGMQQYVEWTTENGHMSQFYTDINIQAKYKDYMTGIILRKNSLTDVVYRDDPTILAWDIANEPSNYGDESGDELQVPLQACLLTS